MTGTSGADLRGGIRAVLANPWFKAIATLAIIGFVLFWLRGQMPFFAEGFSAVARPHWGWIALSVVFAYLSISSYGSVQKLLLRSAGVRVGYRESVGLIFAANAFSTCIPGGQVFGTTLTYRKTRQWGATRVIASWQLVISGVLSTVGIVLLALLGFFLVGTVSNPFLLVLSAIGLVSIVVVIQLAARNPSKIEATLLTVLSWVNARRRKPVDHGARGVRKVVEQAEAVDMTKTDLSKAFAFSLLNWVADIGCLWAAANSVGAQHSIGGLCIAYVTGKIVATAPITPGGLGTVEFALITTLTAGGLGAHAAFATVFVYRIVSFVLIALAGWVIFFLFYRGAVDVDPDEDDPDEDEQRRDHNRMDGHPPSRSATSSSDSGTEPHPPPNTAPTSPADPGQTAELSGARAVLSNGLMWPLSGDPWRPTLPYGSGPIPLGRPRPGHENDDEKGR